MEDRDTQNRSDCRTTTALNLQILKSIACLGAAWMLACSTLLLHAQDAVGPAEVAPVQVDDALANSPDGRQLRIVHRFEKAFFVRACMLSEEQKRELEKLDDSWKEAAAAEAKPANALPVFPNPLVQAVLQGRGRVRNPASTLEIKTKAYRDSLRKKFGELLTADQLDIYQQELAARDEFKQRADSEYLVAVLDEHLSLLPEQREPLIKALAQWPEKNGLYFAYYFQNPGTLPQIPDDLMAKHLSREQLSMYRQAQKVEVRQNQFEMQDELFGE